jgi:hypothetical protein
MNWQDQESVPGVSSLTLKGRRKGLLHEQLDGYFRIIAGFSAGTGHPRHADDCGADHDHASEFPKRLSQALPIALRDLFAFNRFSTRRSQAGRAEVRSLSNRVRVRTGTPTRWDRFLL